VAVSFEADGQGIRVKQQAEDIKKNGNVNFNKKVLSFDQFCCHRIGLLGNCSQSLS